MSLTLSFDIGYASIGWCVLSAGAPAPADPIILGTGVVTFPTDDCLASQRRALRRTRRHIRSTRQRIERLKRWLQHRGILSREELDRSGHPAPFLLSAAALRGHRLLTPFELWTVLRWYAHNRGYDGNSRWARNEETEEDTEKETHALDLMSRAPATGTMAETVCKCLALDPAHSRTRIASTLPYKTLNAAYPRRIVTAEVKQLLNLHLGQIPNLDADAIEMILTPDELPSEARSQLAAANIRLPKRYCGGLLFGQLVPRFDNRIIARCPITWAKQYDEAIQSGLTDPKARQQADKFAKVPAAKSTEFLEYRFARILANLKAAGKPLDSTLRHRLWAIAKERGSLSAPILQKEIAAHCGKVETNVEAYFNLHPDSADALVLDPAQDEIRKASGTAAKLSPIWSLLPEAAKQAARTAWSRSRKITFHELLEKAANNPAVAAALQKTFAKDNKPKRGKTTYTSFESYLQKSGVSPKFPTGRAPYAKPVLRQVVTEVLAGFDPTKASAATDPEKGELKTANGVLFDLNIPTSRVRQLQNQRPLDQLTNNHLVRHRLLILDRLAEDLSSEFCGADPTQVRRVIVEVSRDLREFSGMSAKQITMELNGRLRDFKAAVKYLEDNAPHLPKNGSLIRKCRIAMDLGWCCPFTGEKYDVWDLPKMEREHIIPYATRNTNALHALVLTWPEVNRMKGKRTARQFIAECGSQPIPGKSNLTLFTLRGYDEFVDHLDTKGHDNDIRRKKARKALLATTDFEDKELGFTEGMLTQSGHLMKLALRGLSFTFPEATLDPIPGSVTSEIRKSWDLIGSLSMACPEVMDKIAGKPKPKDEIRAITHLHHALDAATLALTSHYFPLKMGGLDQKGTIWLALLKRRRTDEEKKFLHSLGIFDRYQRHRRDKEGKEYEESDVRLRDLPKELKEQLALSFLEGRVMQHLPSDRSGTKAELNTWGVVSIQGEGEDARVTLRQRATTVEKERRVLVHKEREERGGKLLGPMPEGGSGKLQSISGALIINENYGLALDPVPTVIPFHNVQRRLDEIRKANDGKPPRILRNGMLIRLTNNPARSQQDYTGVWRIASLKNNKGKFLIDMIRPPYVTPQNGVTWSGMNKTLGPLLECGLEILPQRYTAHATPNTKKQP